MKGHTWKWNRGVTLIELVIAMAILAIMLALAAPSLQKIAARAEIKDATDIVAQAFRTAKHSARVNNSSVTLTLTTNGSANGISFIFRNAPDPVDEPWISDSGTRLPDVQLPEKISVSGATAAFTYSPMGLINATGTITLVSTRDAQFASTVVVNNTMGYITASYASLGG